jgi:hypothetical protein
MSPEEQEERIKRAARRAGYHLLKALDEVLAAISAALEELRDGEGETRDRPVKIEVE